MPMKRTLASVRTGKYAKRRRVIAKPGYTRAVGYYGKYPPIGNELKFLDTSLANAVVPNTGQIKQASFVNIVAGTGESQRIGRKVTLRALSLRFVTVLEASTGPSNTDDGCRVILYHDKQCNGTAAAVTDILETASYLSYNNLANKNRFSILADKYIDLSATSGAYNGTTNQFGAKAVTRSIHLRLNVPIEYSGTTGVIAEIRSHNIGLLLVSDKNLIQFNGNCRVRFTDS